MWEEISYNRYTQSESEPEDERLQWQEGVYDMDEYFWEEKEEE